MQAQEGVEEMKQKIEALKKRKADLKTREIELKCKIDAIEKKNKERTKIDVKGREAEVNSLQHQGKEVQDFLDTLKESSSSPKSPNKT